MGDPVAEPLTPSLRPVRVEPRSEPVLLRGLIGAALRRARLHQRRTLRDVATTAQISVPYLSEVERGRKEASSEILAAVCQALDLTLEQLLDEVRLQLRARRPELPARALISEPSATDQWHPLAPPARYVTSGSVTMIAS